MDTDFISFLNFNSLLIHYNQGQSFWHYSVVLLKLHGFMTTQGKQEIQTQNVVSSYAFLMKRVLSVIVTEEMKNTVE